MESHLYSGLYNYMKMMEPTMEHIDSFIGQHEDSKCKSTNVTTCAMAVSLTVIRERATIRESTVVDYVSPKELDVMIRQANPPKPKKKKRRRAKLFIPSQDFDVDDLERQFGQNYDNLAELFIPIQYDCDEIFPQEIATF